ncbi:MAG: cytochrome-c oxidase, cbb3-type subunit I [bacterium]|nr:cytochrome-c oxidase, cbb3-type subunit I [bacterium]
METYRYDDAIVRKFTIATIIWGFVGMLVGLIVALELAFWQTNLSLPWITFGRLRPLHTNAVAFAFTGNAIFAAVYYSSQRLLKTRMFNDTLSAIHFWGWQLLIVFAALTLIFGITTGKEYAELEWPLDIMIAVLWVTFAINFFGTIAIRREPHLYVSIWYFMASILAIAILHIVNSIELPAGFLKSYPVYAGVQDAMVQWWYGHNAVGFLLTTPILGMMYYYLPKQAGQPIYSYRLSIVGFWALIFIYMWAGPHHLMYTALPEWTQTLGMIFSLMLWPPSWASMINGLMTLRGAWDKLRIDPILKFLAVSVTFYGMSTFEGPLMSIKSLNSITHYTDYTVGHVHSGALGWVGFMVFAIIYYMIPRLYRRPLFSRSMAESHFWLGTVGIILYYIPIITAGVIQSLMWKAFDAEGLLKYPNWMETVDAIMPLYWLRVIGGTAYLTGVVLMMVNVYKTMASANKSELVDEEAKAPAMVKESLFQKGGSFFHKYIETAPITMTLLAAVLVSVGGIVQIVPLLLKTKPEPVFGNVIKPYTPLELTGRDIYVKEGCYNCHSQMVRPLRDELMRYGEYSRADEFIYDHPFQWGSRRIGPDLHRLGGKYNDNWHYLHMKDPRAITPGSIMPAYPWLLKDKLDLSNLSRKMEVLRTLGAPYTDEEIANAESIAKQQASEIAERLKVDGHNNTQDKDIVALIAYLQRLGTDFKKIQLIENP